MVADLGAVEALVFDMFGTVVDWRTSVASGVESSSQLLPEAESRMNSRTSGVLNTSRR